MSDKPKDKQPILTVLQGGNEREMHLIRALDKAAGFKDDPEADAALIRAADNYELESKAARARLTLLK